MACKLYYKFGSADYYVGAFKNRKKAVFHWNLVKAFLESQLGHGLVPIYVESSQRRT